MTALMMAVALGVVYVVGPGATGFAVLDTGAIISTNTTLELGESVTSMRVTGSVRGSGNVALYLGERVVFDTVTLNTSLENYCLDTCEVSLGVGSLRAVVDGDVLLIVTSFNYTSDTVVTIPEEVLDEINSENQTDGETEQTTDTAEEETSLFDFVGIEEVFNTSYQSEFDRGLYNRTEYNASGFVQLNASAPLSELPNEQQSTNIFGDEDYIINMSANVVLFHFNNDSSGNKENITHVYDWSNNGHNGTWVGSSSNGTAKLGNFSATFDGSDGVLRVFDTSMNSVDDLSIIFWTKINSNGGDWKAFVSGTTGTSNDYETGFTIDMGSVSTGSFSYINVQFAGDGGDAIDLKTSLHPFGEWVHVAVIFNNSIVKLYVNGIAEDSRSNL